MRWMKRLLGVLLSVLLTGSVFIQVSAAEYPDTYTIRIYVGRQGIMTDCDGGKGRIAGDGKVFVLDGLRYGNRISVSFAEAGSEDDGAEEADGFNRVVMSVREDAGTVSKVTFEVQNKYYVMGIRESGKDNSDRIGSFIVEGDRDYVAAYGMMKDSVEYTINYLDTEGNVLRESEKYRGTIGDKPVVAYQYVDGYQPQAYNLAKTLSANAAENIFTFVYTRETTPVTVITIPGEAAPTAPPNENAVIVIPGEEQPGPEGEGGEVPGPGPGGGEEGPDVPIPDEPVPEVPGPEEYVDLDEEKLPQGGYPGESDSGGPLKNVISFLSGNAFLVNIPMPVKIVLLVVLAALAGGVIWKIVGWILKKHEKDSEKGQEDEA